MSKRMKLIVALILVTELFIGMATGVQRTSLSNLMKRYGFGLLLLFPILSFGVFKATADVAAGILAHRKGRRKIFLLGSLIYFSGTLAIILVEPPSGLVLGNVLVGTGEGIIFAISAVSLSDVLGTEQSSRSFGFMEGTAYLGYGIGAFAGGYIWSLYGIESSFYFAAFSALMAIFASILITETKYYLKAEKRYKYEWKVPVRKALFTLLKNPSIISALVAAHVAKIADTVAWAIIPIFLVKHGIVSFEVGFIQSSLIFVWSLMMPFWSEYSDRAGRRLISTAGLFLNSIALIMFPSAREFHEALLITILMGMSYAMYYPVLPAPIVDLAPLRVKDIAVGIYRGVRDSGYATGALVVGLLLSSEEIQALRTPFLDIGVFLLIIAGLFSIIFRETRPAWPFFDLVVEHASIMRDIIGLNEHVIRDAFAGRLEAAEEKIRRIKSMERRADKMKREIMGKIWSSFLPISNRMDFERLVEELDRIAGAVLECDERLQRLRIKRSLAEVERLMVEMNRELYRIAEKFLENLKALKLSPLYAVNLTVEVERGEGRVDRIRAKLLDEIRRLVDAGEIDLMTAIDLRDAVDLLEMVADDFEDASDIIRIIAYKHAAIPL